MAEDMLGEFAQDNIICDFACGRGSGALYLEKRLKPRLCMGVDFNESTIQHCAYTYPRVDCEKQKTKWCLVDANDIKYDIKPGCLDAMFCVQSLHQFTSPTDFFKEAQIVIKEDGVLLLCDLFMRKEGLVIDRYAGKFTVEKAVDITNEVKAAMLKQDWKDQQEEIKDVSWMFRGMAMEQFGVPGSLIHKLITEGDPDISFWAYVLRRMPIEEELDRAEKPEEINDSNKNE